MSQRIAHGWCRRCRMEKTSVWVRLPTVDEHPLHPPRLDDWVELHLVVAVVGVV